MDEIWWTRLGQLGLLQCLVLIAIFLAVRPTLVRGMTILEAVASTLAPEALAKAKDVAESEVPNAPASFLGKLLAALTGAK